MVALIGGAAILARAQLMKVKGRRRLLTRHADFSGDEQSQEGVSYISRHAYSQLLPSTSSFRGDKRGASSRYGRVLLHAHFSFTLPNHSHLRNVDLLCSVKYKNNLPDVPFGPKFLSYPFDSQRY